MAPLPETNTPRAYIDYTSGGVPHTAQLRFPDSATPASTLEQRNAVAEAMLDCMDTTDSITGHRWSNDGTNVSNPVDGLTGPGTVSGFTINNVTRAAFVSFTGRSSDGRDVKFTLFSPIGSTYTLNRVPLASAGAALNALYDEVTANDGEVVTISGLSPLWNAYVNTRRNSYWQRQLS